MLVQKLIAILALAITVSASPVADRKISATPVDHKTFGDGQGNQNIGNNGQNSVNTVVNSGKVHGDFTVEQSTRTCGNAQLNCCNQISKKGDTKNSNFLALFSGGGDVGINCSPVNAIGVLAVNKACEQKVACCQGDIHQNGLINLGCVNIASLL